MYFNFMEEEK